MSAKHVVCLMPTCNRPDFALHSYGRYRAQTYGRKTLLIVNSGERTEIGSDADDVIEVLREPHPAESGMENFLQNLRHGVAVVRAEIPTADVIAMWEDDDWYAPWRLEHQAESIGDYAAHGYNFGHCYHLVWQQAAFFRPKDASYGATTMLTVAKAASIIMTPDLMMWRHSLSDSGGLEDDEAKVPFINVKHGLTATASGMHGRYCWNKSWDGRDREWFRETVGEESFAFYERKRAEALAKWTTYVEPICG